MDGRRGGGGGGGRGWGRGRSKGGGRWSPRSPSPFFHPQSHSPSVAGDRSDVCGSSTGSNSIEGRKTCLEDDDESNSGSGLGSVNSNKNKNKNKHDDNAMMTQSPCTPPTAALEYIEKKKKEEEVAYSGTGNEDSFDICRNTQQATAATATVVLKPSLLIINRERRRNQIKGTAVLLRPGMLLLKAHISLHDQMMIVRRCRELGVGSGGFYQPGYREGSKLHLRMMCLGKHWDPQSGRYTDLRPCDGAKPPLIPPHFHELVHQAIAHSHSIIQQDYQTPEEILPPMSPDICIVNFYSQSGRLGLHQDKDESPHSLRQGLPVVSFSIGDSADFLYGDDRDVDKAQKLLLDSGDVLIFGGGSRNLFHGVSAIHPMTAPSPLLQQTNLRPGRLNLTFRQY